MQAKTAQETPRKAQIARLRQMMQAHDMRPEDALSGAAGMAIGFDAIDADLPQGLAGDALHEVVAARLGDFPAALGFAWHLAARFTNLLNNLLNRGRRARRMCFTARRMAGCAISASPMHRRCIRPACHRRG